MKSPAFQFYPKDFMETKVLRMSDAAVGLYIKILCRMWADSDDQCSIEDDPKVISKVVCSSPKMVRKVFSQLMWKDDPCFLHEGHRYVSKRLRAEKQKQVANQLKKEEAGKKGADARWHPQCDGNGGAMRVPMANDGSAVAVAVSSAVAVASSLTAQQKQPCSSTDERFAAFWQAYPRKVGKASALRSYLRAVKTTTPAAILASVEKQKGSSQWKREAGKFIPHPTTWLNQGRWDDEPVMPKLPHIHVAPVEEPAEKEFLAMLDKRFLGAPNGLVSARTDDGDGSGGAGQPDAVPGADPGGDGPTPPV